MPPPVSVVICCANSEDTLQAACASVAWADELVIVDSGSKDRTAEIAQRYAHKYVVEPWRGYSKQKEYAVSLAKNDWVLVLDSDEECSPELAAAIAKLTEKDFEQYDVISMARKNYIWGRYVRAWSPDMQNRLINRHKCVWSDDVLHEARRAKDKSREKKISGWLEHKRTSNAGWSDYFSGKRQDERLIKVAEQMYDRGKRAHGIDLILRPMVAFWKSYLFKGGMWSGDFGLLIAQKAAVSTQLKYAALWSVQQEREKVKGKR